MLLLFAISITPKKTLHTIFGCHVETGKRIDHHGVEQVNTKNFHCSCAYQDLLSPFIHTPSYLSAVAFKYADPLISGYRTALFTQTVLSPDLRGPPSVI